MHHCFCPAAGTSVALSHNLIPWGIVPLSCVCIQQKSSLCGGDGKEEEAAEASRSRGCWTLCPAGQEKIATLVSALAGF